MITVFIGYIKNGGAIMSSTTEKKPKTMMYWINSAIVLFCFFGFGLLPELFGLNYAGMRAIGIFIGLLWGWIAVDFAWVSIIGIVAMGTTGVMTVTESFTTSFMSATFFQMLFPMILFAFMTTSGFAEWLAYKMLTMKFLVGHPWRIITMIFLVTSILHFFVHTWATIFLMWPIFIKIAEVAGYQKGDKFVGYIMCTIVMLQTIMASSIPWGFYAVTLQSLMADALNGYPLPFIPILTLGIIGQILTVVIALFYGKFIIRVDVSKLEKMPDDFYVKAETIKLSSQAKFGIGIVLTMIIMVGMPTFLPGTAFATFCNDLNLQGVTALLLAVVLLMRDKEGKPYVKTATLAHTGLSWDILFLVVSTLSLAALMKLPEVGIMEKITGYFIPMAASLPPALFIFGTIMIFWVITQLTHNFVIVLTLVGAFAGVCPAIGINPWLFGWLFMCGMNFAYSTPAASSPGALMYAHEWISKKDAYINGILFSLIGIVVFMLVMYPLANMMFGSIPQ